MVLPWFARMPGYSCVAMAHCRGFSEFLKKKAFSKVNKSECITEKVKHLRLILAVGCYYPI